LSYGSNIGVDNEKIIQNDWQIQNKNYFNSTSNNLFDKRTLLTRVNMAQNQPSRDCTSVILKLISAKT